MHASVHRSLVSHRSSFFAQSKHGASKALHRPDPTHALGFDVHTVVDPSRRVLVKDVEILARAPLSRCTLYPQIRYYLVSYPSYTYRVPSNSNSHALHTLAKDRLHSMIHLTGSVPSVRLDNLEEALSLANEYQITSMQKALYYILVTSPESKDDTEAAQTSNDNSASVATPSSGPGVDIPPKPEVVDPLQSNSDIHQTILSQSDIEICTQLMTRLIDQFTPILFTPPATSHMMCTDVFADTWMPLVIQPALENDGVYKPLETLELMKGTDWEKEGLCSECVKEKHEEWTDEQKNVWRSMDAWLGLN